MNNKNLKEPLLPPAIGLTVRNTKAPPSKTIKPATAWNRIYFGGRKKKLIYAAGKGDLSLVRELIEDYGIDIDSVESDYGITALIAATERGHLEIVRYLVEHGANVNVAIANNGGTALMSACQNGHLEIVHCLVEHGANVNAAMTNDGTFALMCACNKDHLEVVRYLIEHGADVNAARTTDGLTTLMLACQNGQLEAVRYLCQHGADPTLATSDKIKAIDLTKNPDIRNILLNGCSSQAKGGYYRRTRHRRRQKKQSKHATRLRKRK